MLTRNRSPELGSGFEGLVSPGIPVDRVVGMLLEVGAGLKDQPVGELWLPVSGSVVGASLVVPRT